MHLSGEQPSFLFQRNAPKSEGLGGDGNRPNQGSRKRKGQFSLALRAEQRAQLVAIRIAHIRQVQLARCAFAQAGSAFD
jgi:hypothetical protein